VAFAVFLGVQWYLGAGAPDPLPPRTAQRSPKTAPRRATSEITQQRSPTGTAGAYHGHEWTGLKRDLVACTTDQDELMNVPVVWPGFHALCLDHVDDSTVRLLLHSKSERFGNADGAPPLPAGPQSTRVLSAAAGEDESTAPIPRFRRGSTGRAVCGSGRGRRGRVPCQMRTSGESGRHMGAHSVKFNRWPHPKGNERGRQCLVHFCGHSIQFHMLPRL